MLDLKQARDAAASAARLAADARQHRLQEQQVGAHEEPWVHKCMRVYVIACLFFFSVIPDVRVL